MTKRRSISKAMRARVFDAALGICHLCKVKIDAPKGEKWEVEHVKPLWSGGKDDESNMAPAHIDCHATKSKGEAAPRAKTIRQRAAYIGAHSPKQSIPNRGFPKADKPNRIEKLPLPARTRDIFGRAI